MYIGILFRYFIYILIAVVVIFLQGILAAAEEAGSSRGGGRGGRRGGRRRGGRGREGLYLEKKISASNPLLLHLQLELLTHYPIKKLFLHFPN